MEYIKDINILEAVIHVLDNNGDKPVLNDYKVELTEDIYKFIYKHINTMLNDEKLKYAKFKYEENVIKQIANEFLNGECIDLVKISKKIALQMFGIMRVNQNIDSNDLLTVYLSTDIGPVLAVLKLDYIKNFTHKIEFKENKIGVNIVNQMTVLPTSKRIKKCVFITKDLNLMVIDKKEKIKKDEELTENWFTNSFLECSFINTEIDNTRIFLNAAETWTRNNFIDDAERAESIRNAVRSKVKNNEIINIDNLADEIFKEEDGAKENFNFFMQSNLDDEFAIDKEYAAKKLKRVRLKIDNDIDLYISADTYNDPSKFEVKRNGDGTINLVVKHIRNYIEK